MGFSYFCEHRINGGCLPEIIPKSDWMAIVYEYGIPFLISEVTSDEQETAPEYILKQLPLPARGIFFCSLPRRKGFLSWPSTSMPICCPSMS